MASAPARDADDGGVREVRLYARVPWRERLDVWPFAMAYAILAELARRHASDAFEVALIAGAGATLHALAWLSAHWSVRAEALVTCRRVDPPRAAAAILAARADASAPRARTSPLSRLRSLVDLPPEPPALALVFISDGGKIKVESAPLILEDAHDANADADAETRPPPETRLAFSHRRRRFRHLGDGAFAPPSYPDDERFAWYSRRAADLRAHTSADVIAARREYGANVLDIPSPSFGQLLAEQLVAPFFAFQTFCCALWCADEYWYYSLCTLAMLVVCESLMALNRLRTVRDMRRLEPTRAILAVRRDGRWTRLDAAALVPGDVVSVTVAGGGATTKKKGGGRGGTGSGTGGGRDRFIGSGANDHGHDVDVDDAGAVVPCDLLLVAGEATATESMLTGESEPARKFSIASRDPNEFLRLPADRQHVLFGGTRVVSTARGDDDGSGSGFGHETPDGGCLAVVLRTGFATSQGELTRTILFASERVTANSRETAMFILVLLAFALVAAWTVLVDGLADPTRDRRKLFLNVVMILTGVVPPELPMEMSIAVNTSLVALAEVGVFCTEPFRVTRAGKVDVCCFDKTGTLTADDLRLVGVSETTPAGSDSPSKASSSLASPTSDPIAAMVLGACHALEPSPSGRGPPVGDPLERAAAAGAGWRCVDRDVSRGAVGVGVGVGSKAGETRAGTSSAPPSTRALARHLFSPELRRMSAIVRATNVRGGTHWRVAKGAPESVRGCLRVVPEGYDDAHRTLAAAGYRVVALCATACDDALGGANATASESSAAARKMRRDETESNLDFRGFAAFACRTKPASAPALELLRRSAHALVMITGDAPLTACHVAAELGITRRPTLVLTRTDDEGGDFEWRTPEGLVVAPLGSNPATTIPELAESRDLAVCGSGLDAIDALGARLAAARHVQVYARASPAHKERAIRAMREAGLSTMMCGDGTNDVGALKAADAGVALLSEECPGSGFDRATGRSIARRGVTGSNPAGGECARADAESLAARLDAADDRNFADGVSLRPGDASLAAPFTARSAGVAPCLDVIRQGRAALVATLQMFKILGLNCLVSAYVMSVQFLDGVKFGDAQMTAGGLLTAGMFLSLSRACPEERLAPAPPRASVFAPGVVFSVAAQFAAHLAFLLAAVEAAKRTAASGVFQPEPETTPFASDADDAMNPNASASAIVHPLDAPFAPSPINSVSFLVNVLTQTATVAVNYAGAPHSAPISRNTPLLYSVLATYVALAALLAEVSPALNAAAELAPLPRELRTFVAAAAAMDLGACWAADRAFAAAFPPERCEAARTLAGEVDARRK